MMALVRLMTGLGAVKAEAEEAVSARKKRAVFRKIMVVLIVC